MLENTGKRVGTLFKTLLINHQFLYFQNTLWIYSNSWYLILKNIIRASLSYLLIIIFIFIQNEEGWVHKLQYCFHLQFMSLDVAKCSSCLFDSCLGMPYPQNLETAKEVEAIVRKNGAVPATVAILDGKPCIGFNIDLQLNKCNYINLVASFYECFLISAGA